ncbi:MAG: hypothetical protein ACRDJ3_00720 [Solirubrobacteraceae bacterium]
MSQLRAALLLRRNGVESINAQLKHLGLGGTRLRTKCETTLDWLIQWGLLTITATRFVHAEGLYEPTQEVAEQLDLLRPATAESPNPGPDPIQLRRGEAELERIFGALGNPKVALQGDPALDEPNSLAAWSAVSSSLAGRSVAMTAWCRTSPRIVQLRAPTRATEPQRTP